jgi:hypothetical protein
VEQMHGTPITRSQMVAVICRIRTGFFSPLPALASSPRGIRVRGDPSLHTLNAAPTSSLVA